MKSENDSIRTVAPWFAQVNYAFHHMPTLKGLLECLLSL